MNILAGGEINFYNKATISSPSGASSIGFIVNHSNGNKAAELIHGGSGDEGQLNLYDSGTQTVRIAGENNIASYINSGNVGIGTTSPTTKLTVNGGYANFTDGTVNIYTGSDGSGGLFGTITNHYQRFVTNNTERMRITSGGEIGIGTTFVSAKVQIHSTNAGQPTIPLFIVNESTTVGTEARLGFAANTNNDVGSNRYSYISTINTSGSNGQDMIFATNPTGSAASERMRITSSGGVAIGATSTQAQLEVRNTADGSTTAPQFLLYGGASSYGAFHFLDSDAYHIFTNAAARDIEIICDSGGVKLGPGNTAWSSNSDENLKENIKPLNNVLDKIKDYRCVEYNFKDDENEDKKIGFIAQDWQKDFSQVVNKNKQDVLSIKYTETIPVLLKAIQELEARVKELENK